MTPQDIRAAIQASPALLALVPQVNGTQAIAEALSLGRTIVQPHRMSEAGVLERYPGGPLAADAVLAKLDAFAASAHPLAGVVRRALKFLGQPEGLDIGSSATRAMLDALAGGSAITTAEATALKGLAAVPDPVSEFAVRQAIYADNGSLLV
jgi:hypothetical protein